MTFGSVHVDVHVLSVSNVQYIMCVRVLCCVSCCVNQTMCECKINSVSLKPQVLDVPYTTLATSLCHAHSYLAVVFRYL